MMERQSENNWQTLPFPGTGRAPAVYLYFSTVAKIIEMSYVTAVKKVFLNF
jgi:hypothetical protein